MYLFLFVNVGQSVIKVYNFFIIISVGGVGVGVTGVSVAYLLQKCSVKYYQ